MSSSPDEKTWYVVYRADGDVEMHAEVPDDCLKILKELRDKKEEHATRKRELSEEMKQIRNAFSSYLKLQGVGCPGLDTFASFIRLFQTLSREEAKSRLGSEIDPRKAQKTKLDECIFKIDQAIILVKSECWLQTQINTTPSGS